MRVLDAASPEADPILRRICEHDSRKTIDFVYEL